MTLVHDIRTAEAHQRLTCVVIHGLGDSKAGWQPVADELDLPDVRWVFVQAPLPYHGGWSWFRMDESLRVDHGDVTRSHAQLSALIDGLGVDRDRVAVMGFSQGCLMTMELALRADRPFACAIGLSGWLADPAAFPAASGPAAARQRLHWFHGAQDPLVPARLARTHVAHLRGLGLTIDHREFPCGHHLDPRGELDAIRAALSAA